jgi:hypothetical protein
VNLPAGTAFPQGFIPMLNAIHENRAGTGHDAIALFWQYALLWLLFFLICLGLGYAPLNRYDPGTTPGTSDVRAYRDLVMGRKSQRPATGSGPYERLAQSENYYRILVPYVARPFYWMARGHVGTCDPALLGLLVANSIFTAATASLLVYIAGLLGFDFSTALLGALLFLVNFIITNLNLVGLVDSAEGCFLLVIVWSLLTGRWFLLPLWGVAGALAKETFAPLSVLFALGWWISEVRRDRLQIPRLAWICGLGLSCLATVTVVMSAVAGGLVWPWQFAGSMRATPDFLAGLGGCLRDHIFWFTFVWLLPLGLLRLRRLPRPWVLASAMAFCGALALGAYNNAGGNTARALFNVSGPLLSLSAAIFLTGGKKSDCTAM